MNDMFDIAFYIKYKLYNPQASQRFIDNILMKVTSLKIFPYIGSNYKNNQDRFIIYKNFLIIYEIQEKEKIVNIKTIIHRKTNTK